MDHWTCRERGQPLRALSQPPELGSVGQEDCAQAQMGQDRPSVRAGCWITESERPKPRALLISVEITVNVPLKMPTLAK